MVNYYQFLLAETSFVVFVVLMENVFDFELDSYWGCFDGPAIEGLEGFTEDFGGFILLSIFAGCFTGFWCFFLVRVVWVCGSGVFLVLSGNETKSKLGSMVKTP